VICLGLHASQRQDGRVNQLLDAHRLLDLLCDPLVTTATFVHQATQNYAFDPVRYVRDIGTSASVSV